MDELVSIINDKAFCTSLEIAEKFGKSHKHVLEKIDKVISDSAEKSAQCFKLSSYKDASGKNNPMYYINRDGFTFLVMGFTGKKATEWKWKYIEAFNHMERILLEKNTKLWIEYRTNGKVTRRLETDMIKEFCNYAESQGSKNFARYYMIFSKLADTACGITDRDNCSIDQLSKLDLVEKVIRNSIQEGMGINKPYKQIYKDVKSRIETLLEIAYLTA